VINKNLLSLLIFIFIVFNCKKDESELDIFFNLFNKHFTQSIKDGKGIPFFISENKDDSEYFENFGKKFTKEEFYVSNLFYGSKSPENYSLNPRHRFLFYDSYTVTSELKFIDKENIDFIITINGVCEFDSPFYNDSTFIVIPKQERKLHFDIKRINGQFKITALSDIDLLKIERLGGTINFYNADEVFSYKKHIDKSKLKKIQEICGVNFKFQDCNNDIECMDVMDKYYKVFKGSVD
jgi:hypothetical protein